jgi:hypothetical protein
MTALCNSLDQINISFVRVNGKLTGRWIFDIETIRQDSSTTFYAVEFLPASSLVAKEGRVSTSRLSPELLANIAKELDEMLVGRRLKHPVSYIERIVQDLLAMEISPQHDVLNKIAMRIKGALLTDNVLNPDKKTTSAYTMRVPSEGIYFIRKIPPLMIV